MFLAHSITQRSIFESENGTTKRRGCLNGAKTKHAHVGIVSTVIAVSHEAFRAIFH
jgi:hypothetical protein